MLQTMQTVPVQCEAFFRCCDCAYVVASITSTYLTVLLLRTTGEISTEMHQWGVGDPRK